MQLPLLRQMKRLLRFLGLGIGTTLLILVLSLISIPSNAQLIPVDRHPPDFAPPLFKGSGDLASSTQSNLPAQASQSTSFALDLVQQGKTNYQKGQLQQAVTLWQQAADAFAAQGDRLHQAMTLSYLAQAYQQLGIWDKGNTAIAQSLQLLKQPNQGTTGDRLHILAEAQTIQGSLQLDQGQASDAFTSWQLAANAFQQAGDQASVVRSQINQSQALVTLGLYKRANNLLESLYEKLPPEEPLHLAILLNYGETLRLIGYLQPEQLAQPQTSQSSKNSEAILKDALELAQKLQSPVDITKAQISLGNTYRAIYQQQKRLQPNPCPDQKVLAYRGKALQYYQQAAQKTDSPTSKIQALSNQQSLLLATQSDSEPIDADKVLAIATQIQEQLDRLPLSRIALYAQIQLAHNLLQLDQIPSKLKDSKASNQAAQLLEVAVKQAQILGDRAAQSYALGYLGQAYAQQQQGNDALKLTAQALSLTTKALNLAKTINAPEIAYRWFWQLGRLDRANNPERAIKNYNEAYNTLQLLRKDLAFDNSDLQFSFEEHPVEQAYREFADLLLQPQIGGGKELQETKEVDDTNLQKAREVMRSLQITELQNFLQQPCDEASLQQLDDIINKKKSNISESNSPTAIFSPIIFRDRIEVIVRLPKQKLFHYRTDLPEATAKATIAQFQRDLQESYTFDAVKENGQKIYKWLIEPAQKQLESAHIKTIVFVLDGPFRNIPMTALYDGEDYLIEKYAVSVSLGLDLSKADPLPNDRLKVLAASLTNPPYKYGDKFKFAKLTYVKGELDAIQKTMGVAATLIRDEKFTRDLFNQKFNDSSFQIVHLATHGQFSSNPQDTFILTAASKLFLNGKVRLKDFDEMFRTRVLNRADAIELLILSACETASGDDRATLGIAGAAVKAGARSAIASLWSLDDESSQTFIKTFYKTITQPQTSRAEALRQAQLALLQAQDGPYTHPRYWAPFLLVGNWL